MDSSNDEKITQNEEQNEIIQETKFINGSIYEGTWNAIDKTGIGRYIMPHGVILDGEYRNSMPHGHGSIFWPRGQVMDATWNRGYIEEKRYIFADGLLYYEEDWNYCKFPDRRFYYCILNGLNPANKVLRTNDQPTKMIPPCCYDAVEGFFDTNKECIISYDSKKIIRIPTKKEVKWIKDNYRTSWTKLTNHKIKNWLIEYWQYAELAYLLMLPEEEVWWKRLIRFARQSYLPI